MPSSFSSGFDLREAVEELRDSLTSRGPRSAKAAPRDIRSAILTELLVEPMHGYQLIQAIETRSGGTWKPIPGAVYPTLQLLTDEALVTAAQVGERKVYSLTVVGKDVASSIIPEAAADSHPSRSTSVDLAKAGAKLGQALAQFPHSGSAEQSERAIAIIDEARRRLYAILAED